MPKKHKAPWGFNGYGAWNRRHAVRSALRLPVPPGEFRHPDFAAAFAKADRDAAKQRVSPAPATEETAPKVAAPGGADGPDLRSRETLDASVFHNADILAPYTVAIEGEASVFSFGTLEDVWFRLVHELSWSKLIVGELLSEMLVILLCGSLLTLAQVIEEQNVRFRDNVILALTTVRLSTDKIFGWQPTKASTPLEITVLAIYGWIHWLLLSVASALIVARALRPARSGIFSPDSVVNDDSLQVRFMVLRNSNQSSMGFLYNMEFTMQGMTSSGQTVDLPLVRSRYATWRNQCNIITLRHSVKDAASPFNAGYPGGAQKVETVFVTLAALDIDGNQVMLSAVYYDPTLLSSAIERRARPFSRILRNHRYVDMYRVARHPATGAMATKEPKYVCNLDNFIKTRPIQEGEPGFIESAPDA
ncbi:unnamed protein product [Pelagomonas calceolata]|uniref:Uncharacterized protein n=1 Tax=Pelagomonas calceolata TaxID=35677 RepID=A0A8J2SBY2_9STRA|nr:unnamed protein product [Pelagomonas calceolata]